MAIFYYSSSKDSFLFYSCQEDNIFLFIGDVWQINNLLSFSFFYPKKLKFLEIILAEDYVPIDKKKLTIRLKPEFFFTKEYGIMQAMLAVHKLFSLRLSCLASHSSEDISLSLDLSGRLYPCHGKSFSKGQYAHGFITSKSRRQAKPLALTFLDFPQDTVEIFASQCLETEENRAEDFYLVTFFQNKASQVTQAITGVLKNDNFGTTLWLDRENYKEKLAS